MKADLSRILKTKMIYICAVLSVFIVIFQITQKYVNLGQNATGYVAGVKNAMDGFLLPVLVSVPIFLGVFSKELTSKSMQCILGHGLTRGKLITAKILDAAILLAGEFIIITIVVLFLADSSFAISERQMVIALSAVWLRALRFFGYISLAAMIMFLTNSTALGIISCVAFSAVTRLAFMMVQNFSSISIYDYTIDGLLDWALKSIEAGNPGFQVIPVVLYIVAALAITIFFFNRKEFEF